MGGPGQGIQITGLQGLANVGDPERCVGRIQALDLLDEVRPSVRGHRRQFHANGGVQKMGRVRGGALRVCPVFEGDACGPGIILTEAPEDPGQVIEGEGLVDHIIHAGDPPGLGGGADDVGGQGDDGRPGPTACGFPGANAARGLEPVQVRHGSVHENEIVFRLPERRYRLQPVLGEGDNHAETRERRNGHFPIDLRVIDDQDAGSRKRLVAC